MVRADAAAHMPIAGFRSARIGGPDQGEAGGGDDRCGRFLRDAGSDQPDGRRRQRASRGRKALQTAASRGDELAVSGL